MHAGLVAVVGLGVRKWPGALEAVATGGGGVRGACGKGLVAFRVTRTQASRRRCASRLGHLVSCGVGVQLGCGEAQRAGGCFAEMAGGAGYCCGQAVLHLHPAPLATSAGQLPDRCSCRCNGSAGMDTSAHCGTRCVLVTPCDSGRRAHHFLGVSASV
jgi:hypothetical protein